MSKRNKTKLKWAEMNKKQRVFYVLDWVMRGILIVCAFLFIIATISTCAGYNDSDQQQSYAYADEVNTADIVGNGSGYVQFNCNGSLITTTSAFFLDNGSGESSAVSQGFLASISDYVETSTFYILFPSSDSLTFYYNSGTGVEVSSDSSGLYILELSDYDITLPFILLSFSGDFELNERYFIQVSNYSLSSSGGDYNQGYEDGFNEGFQAGADATYDEVYNEGYLAGWENGLSHADEESYNQGYNTGYSDGESAGYDTGYSEGESAGYDSGYVEGYNIGRGDGYDIGLSDGYNDGFAAAGGGGFSWLISSVQEFLNARFFGTFGIGTLVYIALGVILVGAFLKFFAR